MSVGFASRWPVLLRRPVERADLDADGVVTDAAAARWVHQGCDAYLERCAALRARREEAGLRLVRRVVNAPPGGRLGRPDAMVVLAGVPEVRPASFTMRVRLRPVGEESGRALDVACAVRLEDPATGGVADLGDAVTDELIALETTARHVG